MGPDLWPLALAVALWGVPARATDAGLDAGRSGEVGAPVGAAAAAGSPGGAGLSDAGFAAGAGPSADAGAAADAGTPVELADLRAEQVRALAQGTLDPRVEPQSLFDVRLDDEPALQVERVRLDELFKALEAKKPTAKQLRSPKPDLSALGLAQNTPEWRAREALDRARLDFYALPKADRDAALKKHAERQEAARPKETEAQRRAREAEAERQRALEAARAARSEAQRVLGEETARLVGLQHAVEVEAEHLKAKRQALDALRDATLGWQRKVRDAKQGDAEDADATYDALRHALRAARDALAHAIDELDSSASELPALGADPLASLPPDAAVDEVRERRRQVEKATRLASAEEAQLRKDRAAALLEEVDALNRERLDLLPHLTSHRRSELTGFTEAGLDQARAEARHLLLILRYHRHVLTGWVQQLRAGQGLTSWWRLLVGVPWLLAVLAFVWWRRRSPALLAQFERRAAELDRAERRTSPGMLRRVLRFARGVHRPLEWLALFGVTLWLLPEAATALLEVQLLTVVVGWSLLGMLVVDAINALALAAESPLIHASDALDKLRLRSLRLVGRVVVGFVLALVLTARLVGVGTIHAWVRSVAWLAAVPVFLILVRWWRATIFQRAERVRRKSRWLQWVLDNRTGWKSFFAAMVAGVLLFAFGSFKTVRNWLSEFNLARRAGAWLFKRELERLAEEKPAPQFQPLQSEAWQSLAPDRMGQKWVAGPADEHLEALAQRAGQRQGGVVALVGGRGMGKSSLLARLAGRVKGSALVQCRSDLPVSELRAAVTPPAAADGEVAVPSLAVLDDAHLLVKLAMGGLKRFDEALAFARSKSRDTLWVFALDAAAWPFLRRARDARPMFDKVVVLEPWSAEQVDELLSERSAEARLELTFEDLLERLPRGADELDRLEALEQKRDGYFQMVWDYARGNPAMALEVWRTSLVRAGHGPARVRPLQAPDPQVLERLPDASLFVLRAVLQLGPATPLDVAAATRLNETQVQNSLRFGEAHGWLKEHEGRVHVTWAWLRAVTVMLERRHLLVNP